MNLPDLSPLPWNLELFAELEVNRGRRGQLTGWSYTPTLSGSVTIALSAFLRKAFLFVEYLGFELFSPFLQIGVAFVIWKEDVPFDLLQWDLVLSIKVLGDAVT